MLLTGPLYESHGLTGHIASYSMPEEYDTSPNNICDLYMHNDDICIVFGNEEYNFIIPGNVYEILNDGLKERPTSIYVRVATPFIVEELRKRWKMFKYLKYRSLLKREVH
ncbi:hypothetical protein JEZ13_04200 [bacterium]|nr:hypothetical protein [bacterium]MBI9072939.1 hypothetical protein [Melioribacteraceae bacterium]